MQNKKQSLIESIFNTTIGLITSFIIQIFIYKSLEISVTIGQNVLITVTFFVVSIVRNYLVRRIFNIIN